MNYHNIQKDDMLNGPGLRVVLFVSGCIHGCINCHNPQTHAVDSGILFDNEAEKELFLELDKPYIQGITFSGGDPLHPNNRETIGDLIKKIKSKYHNKNIWLYTGFLFEDIKHLDFIKYIDVICDGKYDLTKTNPNPKWVGSYNQRVIDVKKTLESKGVILYND